jgi:hypothetical protein
MLPLNIEHAGSKPGFYCRRADFYLDINAGIHQIMEGPCCWKKVRNASGAESAGKNKHHSMTGSRNLDRSGREGNTPGSGEHA